MLDLPKTGVLGEGVRSGEIARALAVGCRPPWYLALMHVTAVCWDRRGANNHSGSQASEFPLLFVVLAEHRFPLQARSIV